MRAFYVAMLATSVIAVYVLYFTDLTTASAWGVLA